MLLSLPRLRPVPWTPLVFPLFAFWGFLFMHRARQDKYLPTTPKALDKKSDEATNSSDEDTANAHGTQDPPGNFPPTEEQMEESIESFIDSIDEDVVCRLASEHNGRKPCTIVKRDRGSFNACFFVHFDDQDTTWVVRIPLGPVVRNPWDKVQSEATTMRYIERKTKIPIPHVQAYGQCVGLIKGSSRAQAFLIYDFVDGQPLNIRMLAKATKNQRKRFYGHLIDILAQLRKLEFPEAGSLMPNADKESEPLVGGFLSMAANELQRCRREQGTSRTFTSEKEYMDYQFRILSETYCLPAEDLDPEQAQMELFALDSLQGQIPKLTDSQRPDGPFVLSHLDLRCGDIIVSDDLRIRGIIDWEFAGTVPQHLFTPPPWITGYNLAVVAAVPHIYTEFLKVLAAKSTASQDCANLKRGWECVPELMLPMAQIFRHPSSLMHIYYTFIFPKLFQGHRRQVVLEFFQRRDIASTLGVRAKHPIEESERYTQHLKEQGLFVDEE